MAVVRGVVPVKAWLLARGPFAKGFLGAALALGLLLVLTWVSLRWQEFEVMRADIAFIHPQIQQAREQAKAAAPSPPPVVQAPKSP